MANIKVAVGMSGGVDSSVAAYLLKKEGYDVYGFTMKLIDGESTDNSINDAKKICDFLGIKHTILDLRDEFRQIVIKNFIDSYKAGKTPNPCVVCNRYFKFGLFYDKIKELGIDKISTGHYANIENGMLKISSSKDKDQSYFLYGIRKEVLDNIIFPLANFNNKDEVRKIAQELNLCTSHKKDSQEVCFVPNDDYSKYVMDNINEPVVKGDIVLNDGTILGKHNGLINYTIGQRRGLGISYHRPLYVIDIDVLNNKIIVGENDLLFNDKLVATNINLLSDEIDGERLVKIRSRAIPAKAHVTLKNDKLIVKFYEKQRAITKGQSVVIYDDNGICLGGGIIEEIL